MADAAVNLSVDICGLIATKKSTMAGGAVVNLYICGLIATKNLQWQVQLSS